jgi:hypothetical protein
MSAPISTPMSTPTPRNAFWVLNPPSNPISPYLSSSLPSNLPPSLSRQFINSFKKALTSVPYHTTKPGQCLDPFQNFPEKVDEIRDVRNYVEVRTGGSEGQVRDK